MNENIISKREFDVLSRFPSFKVELVRAIAGGNFDMNTNELLCSKFEVVQSKAEPSEIETITTFLDRVGTLIFEGVEAAQIVEAFNLLQPKQVITQTVREQLLNRRQELKRDLLGKRPTKS